MHGVALEDALKGLHMLLPAAIEPDRIAAVISELVQGEDGFYMVPAELMKAIRDICDKHGMIMKAIEFFDRTGGPSAPFAKDVKDLALKNGLILLTCGIYGHVVRPFGAVIFVHYGDKIGRKKSFVVTLLMWDGAFRSRYELESCHQDIEYVVDKIIEVGVCRFLLAGITLSVCQFHQGGPFRHGVLKGAGF